MREQPRNNTENESMLKGTALTFTLEGLSKDLDKYLQKKITFNNRSFKYLSEMIQSLSASSSPELKKEIFKKDSQINKMLIHLNEEITVINYFLNKTVEKILNNEAALKSELSMMSDKKNHGGTSL